MIISLVVAEQQRDDIYIYFFLFSFFFFFLFFSPSLFFSFFFFLSFFLFIFSRSLEMNRNDRANFSQVIWSWLVLFMVGRTMAVGMLCVTSDNVSDRRKQVRKAVGDLRGRIYMSDFRGLILKFQREDENKRMVFRRKVGQEGTAEACHGFLLFFYIFFNREERRRHRRQFGSRFFFFFFFFFFCSTKKLIHNGVEFFG